mgnify:FL=1|jgi:sugar transferase EpsL
MYLFVKRVIDMIMSGLGLIILSPLLVIISVIIFIQMGRPVLFKQMRPGLNGKPFYMYKFRTMRQPKENETMYLTDSERVTKLGKFLRNYSLDELPELINVLKGDMSLVGPRPLLMEYLDLYTEEQKRRHDVKPGITGWAQVNGRQNITFSKRFEYDVWYVDNMNFLLDLKILCLTVKKVFIREGVNTGQSISDVDDIGLLMAASRDESERGSGNDLWEKS